MHELAPTLADLYACVQHDLDAVRQIFDRELQSDLDCVNGLCRRGEAYRGKMIRPALLLLSARAVGNVSNVHRTLAAVVEMVHVATLVHDDVLDQADLRRKHPTIRCTDGNVGAVLLGDYLISHAFHLCSSPHDRHAARRIGATTNRICEGELLQNAHAGNAALTEDEYLEIIGRKTGALTSVACELGGHYAGADSAVVGALAEYGLHAGIAFQIVDDVLDLAGDRREVGKSLGLDLSRGKLTLATIHCLRHAAPAVASKLAAVVTGHAPADSRDLRRWLETTQSLSYALSTADEFVHRAIRRLDTLPLGEARQSLTSLAEFIPHRTF